MKGIVRLLAFLLRFSRHLRAARLTLAVVVVLGILSGVSNAGLIALVNARLSGDAAAPALLAAFVALCVVLPTSRLASNLLLLRLTQASLFSLRTQLSRRILQVPLRHLEGLGSHRLLASLTDDVGRISDALVSVPRFVMHVSIIAGSLAYLGWLSPRGLLLVAAFMAVGVVAYRWPMARASRWFEIARRHWTTAFKGFEALTRGVKELKLHRRRRQGFLAASLEAPLLALQKSGFRGGAFASSAISVGQILFFVLIGLALFLPQWNPERRVLTGYALTILYMTVPLESLLNMLPQFSRARIALEQVERLGLSLAEAPAEPEAAADPPPLGEELRFRGVTHCYRGEAEEDRFVLGPLDLAFRRGELTFVVGGNGSGKTTLAKLLTGLYAPESGEVMVDGAVVDDGGRDRYRQLFSAVFSDFYLFDTLLGLEAPHLDGKAAAYLRQLHLHEIVTVRDGALSTLELSQGQRRRLALLTAYLEDRPVYVFDEWAADQDPYFKDVFYRQLLPELRARGKTVIVVTHDDRFYDVADRIIKLESGRVAEDRGPRLAGAVLPASPLAAVVVAADQPDA